MPNGQVFKSHFNTKKPKIGFENVRYLDSQCTKVKILPKEAECNLLWISDLVCKDLPEVLADSRSPKQISLLETLQEPEI